jgi:hypothetical protein
MFALQAITMTTMETHLNQVVSSPSQDLQQVHIHIILVLRVWHAIPIGEGGRKRKIERCGMLYPGEGGREEGKEVKHVDKLDTVACNIGLPTDHRCHLHQ